MAKLAACLLLVTIHIALAAKLNTPRVLLPYNFQKNPVKYVLEVTETTSECFVWSSLQEDVVLVEPLDSGGCSNTATVTAITRLSNTQKAIILVEDAENGVVLRCDVIVGAPAALSIATTTREIYVEEAAEQFEVVALDAEGNQFSSLDGVALRWTVKAAGAAPPCVRIQPFAESNYDTTQAIEALESRGMRGDKVLLVGAATGTAQVTAQLQHADFGELVTPSVRLASVANLMLLPQDVYMLPGARLRYTASQVKGSRLHNIKLESSPYFLDVKDSAVARLEGSQTVLALLQGSTEVHLLDGNAEGGAAGATARLHVTEPASLTITSPSHPDWVAVTGQRVRLQSHLWDVRGNKLYMGQNAVVRLSVEEEFVRPELTSENGTYVEGSTVAVGHAKVHAELSGYTLPDGSELRLSAPLVATAVLEVYPPLQMAPPQLVLPWNPETQPSYQIQLNYTGGDGSVSWSSSNSQLGSVSQQGLLRTRGQGHTTVTVSLARNPRIQARAQVYVVPVAGLALLPGAREAEVGRPLLLTVALRALLPDGSAANFTRCHRVPLDVQLSNDMFQLQDDDVAGEVPAGGCRQLAVLGTEPGHARATVRMAAPWVEAEAAALVGAYAPLTVTGVEKSLLLAPGSSWRLQVQGGPLPWPTRPSKHYSTAESTSDAVSVEPVPAAEAGLFSWVQCRSLGEARLRLSVGNAPSSELPQPAVAAAALPVLCAVPRRLRLRPRLTPLPARQLLELPGCPQQTPLPAHAGQPLPLQLSCEDAAGGRFHNASSLRLSWSESSGGVLAELRDSADGVGLAAYDWRTVMPSGREGDLTVKAVMTAAGDEKVRLEAALPLRLVSPPQVSPPELVVFNHPRSREFVRVRGGSGQVAVRAAAPAQTGLASCSYHAENATVSVVPRADGALTLEVWDLCLAAAPPALLAVQISGVTGVELSVVSRLAVGATTQARLAVLAAGRRPLPARLLPLLNVSLTPASPALAVRYAAAAGDDYHVFDVGGAVVGEAALTARAGAAAVAERRLEVFAPLRLSPRNRTLCVGSQYQLTAAGGPRTDVELRYLSSEQGRAEVSAAGLVAARSPGAVRLTGRLSGHDPGLGRHTVYSEDSVEARVVLLCGVRLRAPLSWLLRGRRQPMYADGVDEHGTAFPLSSPPPGITFRWSSSFPQTAAVSHPFSELCVSSDEGVAMRLTALEPGKAQVSVQLEFGESGRPDGCPADLPSNSSLHVTVYEELRLQSPPVTAEALLMAPHSWLELVTSVPAAASSEQGLVTAAGRQLRAGAATGRDIVTLRSGPDPAGNQTLALPVEVLPVHYLMVTPVADVCVRPGATRLPSGLTVRLNVTAHDARGRALAAWPGAAAPVASRADLLQPAGTGGQLEVTLRRPGSASLTVPSAAQPLLGDVVFFEVDDLLPGSLTELTAGQVACLPAPLTSSGGGAGQWRSDDPDTAQVSAGGALAALRPGSASLTLALAGGRQARVAVAVHPVTEVSLSTPSAGSVSACRAEPLAVPLVLSGAAAEVRSCADALPAAPPPVHCALALSRTTAGVSADRLFTAEAVFDAATGGYQCRLTALCPADAAAARLTADLLLTAEVEAAPGQPPVTSEPVRLLLVPPVHLETAELRLGGPLQTGELLLTGAAHVLQTVTAAVTHSQILQVSAPRRDGDRLRVPVALRPAAWTVAPPASAAVTLSVPATGQTLSVPVLLAPAQGTWQPPPPPPGWGHVLSLLATHYWAWLCNTLTAVGVATLVYLLLRQLRSSAPAPAAPLPPPPQYGSTVGYSPSALQPSPGRTHLWTDDTGPIYGSPVVRRSSPYFDGDRSRSSPYDSDRSGRSGLADTSFR